MNTVETVIHRIEELCQERGITVNALNNPSIKTTS